MINSRWIALLSPLILASPSVDAKIYHCQDKKGRMVFKDRKCQTNEVLVNIIESKGIKNIIGNDIEELKLDKSHEIIYQGNIHGNDTRFVRVALVEETDEYILLEVVGYFSGSPEGTMEFRAVPNVSWGYSGDVHAKNRGFVKAFTRISLNSSAKSEEQSDILTLQLWHYSPERKASRMGVLSVPYKKVWRKKVN